MFNNICTYNEFIIYNGYVNSSEIIDLKKRERTKQKVKVYFSKFQSTFDQCLSLRSYITLTTASSGFGISLPSPNVNFEGVIH